VPPDPGRGAARHEQHGTLADFLDRALSLAGCGGPISLVLRQQRLGELRRTLDEQNGAIVRLRSVVPRPGVAPRHALVELRRQPRSPERLEPPLVVHAGTGREYSDEVSALLRERTSIPAARPSGAAVDE
jgi:tRNA1Val (adenine37-N6)-methyltransferase